MIPSLDFIAVLLLIGVAQGLLLSLSLCTSSKGNKRANRMLGLFVIVSSYLIFNNFLVRTKYLIYLPHLAIVGGPLVFLTVVLLYWYIKLMTDEEFEFTYKESFHLFPAFGAALLLVPFYSMNAEEKILYVYRNDIPLERTIREAAQLIQRIAYIIVCVRILLHHRRRIQDEFSTMERINLQWLLTLVIGAGVIWISAFIMGAVRISVSTSSVIPVLLTLLIVVMGYYGLRQPEIFTHHGKKPQKEITTAKYGTSPLTAEYMETILLRLKNHMTSSRPFTDPNLTLASLAKQVNVKSHHLSQIVNEKTGKNFFEFINFYRIEEAKKRLREDAAKDMTLLSLAYEVGFNSKSVFNTAFKKYTGTTPSEFRAQCMQQ